MDYNLPDLKLGPCQVSILCHNRVKLTFSLFNFHADLELSLAHTVHDHVKRDHIFCLSTSSGNSYYMQVYIQQLCQRYAL